jgi:hypothetical protein
VYCDRKETWKDVVRGMNQHEAVLCYRCRSIHLRSDAVTNVHAPFNQSTLPAMVICKIHMSGISQA